MSQGKVIFGKRQLALAVSTATALFAAPFNTAIAQEELEEVTVTGSRIARDVGFTSPVPVTALTRDELNMFEPGLGVSEQLENLPQFFNNVSSDNIANRVTADVGQSQLNMRGMGGGRTLVLLDGLRVVPSDRRSSVSVDYLPSTLIQRVDVVTGGASAAYGADALAGVTNFVLNRNFTGLDVSYRTGMNEEGDGEFNRGSVTWGDDFMDGQLHVFGSMEARVNDAYRRTADWDKRSGYVRNPAWTSTAVGVPLRLTQQYVYSTNFSPTGLISQAGSALNRQQFTQNGTGVEPFNNGQFASFAGPGNQNTAVGKPGDYQYDLFVRGHPQSIERVGVEQQTLFVGADYDITDNTTLWGHFLYGRTHNQPEPSSSGGAGTGLGHAALAYMTVYRDNPFLPAAVQQTMVNENRQSIRVDQHGMLDVPWGIMEKPQIVNRIGSLTLGFNTELWGDWDLRGSYQYGEAQKHNENIGWERLDRFYLAMDAVTDPATGQPICRIKQVQQQLAAQGRNLEAELHQWALTNTRVFRGDFGAKTPGKPEPVDYPIAVDSIDGTISDCVPVNMFGKGLQSQAALDYIHSSRSKTGISTQELDFAELLATGTIHEGWGAGAISGALGATWRDAYIEQIVVDDAIDALGAPCNVTLPDGTVAIRGVAPAINCSATADNLHRFSGQPEFKGGYDVYEIFGETIVPLFNANDGDQNAELNLAARWSNYSRAGEIVSWKAGLSFQVYSDLRLRGTLSKDIREGSFEELFVQQGRGANVTDPWNNNISYTTFNLTGGNPDLKAEEADTTVIGFVYQPSFVEGLSFSADRYVVDLSSAIGNFTEQQTVDSCFRDNVLCDQIVFGSDGLISTIRVGFININAAKVSGYDFEASYRLEPDLFGNQAESLNFRLIAGYMDENSTTPLNGPTTDQAGSATIPQKTATGNIMYTIGNVGFTLQHYWQDETVRNVQWIEGRDVDDNSVGTVNLTNLGLFWNGETASGTWRASLNVNNVLDKDPVIAGTTRIGDDVGRRYSLGFDYSF
jgi:outer membrane receptor protein involved in Fe transport